MYWTIFARPPYYGQAILVSASDVTSQEHPVFCVCQRHVTKMAKPALVVVVPLWLLYA
jgi:hypothetical protein